MPTYSLNHIHHESTDVHAARDWYVKMFDADADDEYESGGATWIRVHFGGITVTITNRSEIGTPLERFTGYDHLGIMTDDFDATLKRIEEAGVDIWAGPLDGDMRLVFINGPDNVKIELMEKK